MEKRIISILLVMVLILTMTACVTNQDETVIAFESPSNALNYDEINDLEDMQEKVWSLFNSWNDFTPEQQSEIKEDFIIAFDKTQDVFAKPRKKNCFFSNSVVK